MKNGGVFVSIALLVTITLVMGVIFVNGWTDAPNAIATAVSTRVLKPNVAIWMAVVMNFLGALVMTFFNAQVAETISNIVSFDANGTLHRWLWLLRFFQLWFGQLLRGILVFPQVKAMR